MLDKNTWVSWLVGGLAVLLLLFPPFLTAIVWTTVNLILTAIAIVATISVAFFVPKMKWVLATISAFLIALPPYPNWIFWSETEGWHFWLGPSVRNLEIGSSFIVFVVALLPFIALFWAIDRNRRRRL